MDAVAQCQIPGDMVVIFIRLAPDGRVAHQGGDQPGQLILVQIGVNGVLDRDRGDAVIQLRR